ncbi:MAG: SDR family NAD(P)-dependent oxidoreductase [Acidimicrobiales bacterium]|nr:SDR family NAD(P)-dependent oxidoreductase [Acidimicrobiales bacterium]
MTGFIELDRAAAVVTGAGSGIGRACALSFAERGARVIVSDIDADRVSAVVEEIRATGGTATGRRVDVTDTADLEALRDTCLSEHGRVDLVMNNVGVLAMGPPETLPLDAWQRVIDINVLGIVRSNLVFLPLLLEQGRGHVVNTASVSGLFAHGFDRLPYVTTKHAVVGMTESLAIYLRPKGIGVTCLCPSGVNTNIVEQISFHGPASTPRAPDHPVVDAAVVGELVADAVESGRFLVLTVPEVLDEIVERAADIDAYVERESRIT